MTDRLPSIERRFDRDPGSITIDDVRWLLWAVEKARRDLEAARHIGSMSPAQIIDRDEARTALVEAAAEVERLRAALTAAIPVMESFEDFWEEPGDNDDIKAALAKCRAAAGTGPTEVSDG